MSIVAALPDLSKEREESLQELFTNLHVHICQVTGLSTEEWRQAQLGLVWPAAAGRNIQTNQDEFFSDLPGVRGLDRLGASEATRDNCGVAQP